MLIIDPERCYLCIQGNYYIEADYSEMRIKEGSFPYL